MRILLLLSLCSVLFSQNLKVTCEYPGYVINKHPTTKTYKYFVTCYNGNCKVNSSTPGVYGFEISEQNFRNKHMSNCNYLGKEISKFNSSWR